KLRERIGESLKTIRGSEPLERVTTASLDALRRYSQGVKAFDGGENDRAAALLEEAVALDTGFAMAYRKLAVIGFNTFLAPAQIGLGKLAEAAKTVDRFEQRAAGNPFLLVFRSRLAEARRAYDSAEAYQRARLQGTDLARRANTYFTLAALHLVRGRLAEAEAAGRAYMETSERRGLPGAYLDGAVGLALLNVRYRHATGTGRRTVEAALARRPLPRVA